MSGGKKSGILRRARARRVHVLSAEDDDATKEQKTPTTDSRKAAARGGLFLHFRRSGGTG